MVRRDKATPPPPSREVALAPLASAKLERVEAGNGKSHGEFVGNARQCALTQYGGRRCFFLSRVNQSYPHSIHLLIITSIWAISILHLNMQLLCKELDIGPSLPSYIFNALSACRKNCVLWFSNAGLSIRASFRAPYLQPRYTLVKRFMLISCDMRTTRTCTRHAMP